VSEKIDPEVDQTVNQTPEDDPLAELARIVAGEPEPVRESRDVEPVIGQSPDESGVSDLDMEAALADALGNEAAPAPQAMTVEETSFEEAPAEEIVPEPEFNAREEITRAVDQVVNEEAAPAYADAPPLQEPVLEERFHEQLAGVQEVATEPEVSFEDGLISALENELAPQSAEPIDATGAGEFESLENALSVELADELATDVQDSYEPAQQFVEELPPEPVFDDPQGSAPLVSDDIEPEPIYSEIPAADEDLGTAFSNEFEQMLAQDNGHTHAETVPEHTTSPESGNMFVEEAAEPVSTMTVEADAPRSLDELDFGSAFAEELGVEKVEEVGGWEAGDTEAAQAEFSGALHTDEMTLEHHDPGHSGEIPAVPTGVILGSEQAEPKNGSSMKYAMAALIIALFAGSIFAGYGFLGGGEGTVAESEPQIIKAETDAIKEVPDDPGGRIVANQDKASYEKVEGGDGEKLEQESLISNTEEPAEIISTGVNDGTIVETNLTEKTDDRLSGGSDEETTPATAGANGEVAPRVVQTVTVKPDGTIVPAAPSVPKIAETISGTATELASNALTSVEDAGTNLSEALRIEPKPVETEVISRPEPIDGAKSTGETAVPEASPLPKPVVKVKPKPVETAAAQPKEPAALAAPAAVRRSEWVVQVSSQRTPEAAQTSFTNLRNRFNVLQGRPMSVQRANVNGSTFYRVRVQTTSRSDANQLCSRLQSAGGSCFVTR